MPHAYALACFIADDPMLGALTVIVIFQLAGELLAKEAGAIVTDFVGGHNYENSGNIVVANPRVLKEMLGKIRENLPESLAK